MNSYFRDINYLRERIQRIKHLNCDQDGQGEGGGFGLALVEEAARIVKAYYFAACCVRRCLEGEREVSLIELKAGF